MGGGGAGFLGKVKRFSLCAPRAQPLLNYRMEVTWPSATKRWSLQCQSRRKQGPMVGRGSTTSTSLEHPSRGYSTGYEAVAGMYIVTTCSILVKEWQPSKSTMPDALGSKCRNKPSSLGAAHGTGRQVFLHDRCWDAWCPRCTLTYAEYRLITTIIQSTRAQWSSWTTQRISKNGHESLSIWQDEI